MGRYTQHLRLRARTAELAIARAHWRGFLVGALLGAALAVAAAVVR